MRTGAANAPGRSRTAAMTGPPYRPVQATIAPPSGRSAAVTLPVRASPPSRCGAPKPAPGARSATWNPSAVANTARARPSGATVSWSTPAGRHTVPIRCGAPNISPGLANVAHSCVAWPGRAVGRNPPDDDSLARGAHPDPDEDRRGQIRRGGAGERVGGAEPPARHAPGDDQAHRRFGHDRRGHERVAAFGNRDRGLRRKRVPFQRKRVHCRPPVPTWVTQLNPHVRRLRGAFVADDEPQHAGAAGPGSHAWTGARARSGPVVTGRSSSPAVVACRNWTRCPTEHASSPGAPVARMRPEVSPTG